MADNNGMLSEIDFQMYRCPIDPKREAAIELVDDLHLYCVRCRVRFNSKDGIPSFVVADAHMPEGCTNLKDLPCRARGAD